MRSVRAVLAREQGRQLVSTERLDAQCKEYFEWIRKCSQTKSFDYGLSDDKGRELQFAAWAEGKK
jgi:hypothetical protein